MCRNVSVTLYHFSTLDRELHPTLYELKNIWMSTMLLPGPHLWPWTIHSQCRLVTKCGSQLARGNYCAVKCRCCTTLIVQINDMLNTRNSRLDAPKKCKTISSTNFQSRNTSAHKWTHFAPKLKSRKNNRYLNFHMHILHNKTAISNLLQQVH